MTENKSIKNWNPDDRPREKMLQKGAASLTDAELLAILISSGTKEDSAIDLARKVLEKANNNLAELGRLSLKEMQQTKGIGEARAITIAAALELGRRRQMGEGLEQVFIRRSLDAAGIFIPLLRDLNHECCCAIYLTQSSKLIKYEILSNGGIDHTVVDIRIILKNCLMNNAVKLMIAHNHPGGGLKPSEQDLRLTQNLVNSASLMSIKLVDHLIICGNQYLSMGDEGYM